MKISGYTVYSNADYFSYKNSQKQEDVSVVETKIGNSSLGSFKSNELDSDGITQNLVSVQNSGEDSTIKNLSISLLEGINKKVKLGSNLGLNTVYTETQALKFETNAIVKTEDKKIELDLNVSLSRSFVEQVKTPQINFSNITKLWDPLILDMSGVLPSLSSKKFSFDIDIDGTNEQISMLEKESAFLAFDKNENNNVDDGGELFGAKSGDGFEELRGYDDDKNGWIDENDNIFDKLKIWQKTENKNELIAIEEVGIGAIFLGDISTPFEIKSSSNELLGAMKKSSFFLFENGKSSLISQIDLAIITDKETLDGVSATINSLNKLQGMNLYKNKDTNSTGSSDARLEKLQELLKSTEAKLPTASEDEKLSLQDKINSINSQIMSLVLAKNV
ncbi:hypothetical protein [Sulfurimonas sp. RIFOXYB12_FULL_35_9]|uniref:hypothetical protein n=1 Tax=Sulfurimonas sp. RIFOXYB12_FULL_35_9 TaxID=1802256 RepID=UPI0008C24188|nr:hypothetical protein [Sulfurimonas sp. RIFOXYB12_FULL_35_9]OHE03593.1 MAG: hypothetical protein A2345_10925 [Sulfurimonas sp. RIFOXYB12_FULL_35_9]